MKILFFEYNISLRRKIRENMQTWQQKHKLQYNIDTSEQRVIDRILQFSDYRFLVQVVSA